MGLVAGATLLPLQTQSDMVHLQYSKKEWVPGGRRGHLAWGETAREGGVNAHIYCWIEEELTWKGRRNPKPAMCCCLMPYGDTMEPHAFPGDVFYKSS